MTWVGVSPLMQFVQGVQHSLGWSDPWGGRTHRMGVRGDVDVGVVRVRAFRSRKVGSVHSACRAAAGCRGLVWRRAAPVLRAWDTSSHVEPSVGHPHHHPRWSHTHDTHRHHHHVAKIFFAFANVVPPTKSCVGVAWTHVTKTRRRGLRTCVHHLAHKY